MPINAILAAMGLKAGYDVGKRVKTGIGRISSNVSAYDKAKADAKLYRDAKAALYNPRGATNAEKERIIGGEEGMRKLKSVGIDPKRIRMNPDEPRPNPTISRQGLSDSLQKTMAKTGRKLGIPQNGGSAAKSIGSGFRKMEKAKSFDPGSYVKSHMAKPAASKPGSMLQSRDKVLAKMGLSPSDIAPKAPAKPKKPKMPSTHGPVTPMGSKMPKF